MTVNAPVTAGLGPAGWVFAGIQMVAGKGGSTAIADLVNRNIRAAVGPRLTPPPPAVVAPPAPPSPPVFNPPVVVGPNVPGPRMPPVLGAGGRTAVGSAFLTGYTIGTAFWNTYGTSILDRIMPGYDPNATYTPPYRAGQGRQAYEAMQRERDALRMAEQLRRAEAERINEEWRRRVDREAARRRAEDVLQEVRDRRRDRMTGLEEIKVTAKRLPTPPAPSGLPKWLALAMKYQKQIALASTVFGLFQRFRKQPAESVPPGGETDTVAPESPAPSTFYDVNYNTRPATFTPTEMSQAPETAGKRCPPCKKGSQRKRKKNACRNPITRRTKRTRDGAQFVTITRRIQCQP